MEVGELGLLDGKVAIVTHGASDMGRAIAMLAVSEGARVVIADPDGDAIGAMIGHLGHNYADGIVCEFREEARVADAIALPVRRFGRLDASLNCFLASPSTPLSATAASEWERETIVPLTGLFLCLRQEAPVLARGGGGTITNVGGAPTASVLWSGALALASALTLELGPDIRVNSVPAPASDPDCAARVAVYVASARTSLSGELVDTTAADFAARYADIARYVSAGG